MIEEILAYNQQFVEQKQYEQFGTSKYPNKRVAILTCMDTRLTELLPAALGIRNGDVKLIKNAGAVISSPFGSVMRSLIVAIYDLGVDEILVIGHHDCGMQSMNSKAILTKMQSRNVSADKLDLMKYCGVDFEDWLGGFENVEESVRATVNFILHHPLIPDDVEVHGLVMDPDTGAISRV